jgi:hypothetical protein
MMNGAGVTNYDAGGRPSYGFTASTTQFDEELIRRGIVTRQQALMAKGMTAAQAQELLQNDEPERSATSRTQKANADETEDVGYDEFNDDEDEVDDEFVQEYRRKRLAAIMMAQEAARTEPLQIDRTEWTRHVNEASQHRWVVVCLTSSDTERTGRMEHAIRIIARATGGTRRSTPCTDPTTNSKTTDDGDDAGTVGTIPPPSFVFIPAHGAIPNWPVSNLPSLFLYRHGTMQHELIRLRTDLTPRDVLGILQTAGVLVVEADIDIDDAEESDVV